MTVTPDFSIVIPTYNRPHVLPGLLEALARLTPPIGGFEVVLIDDGGREPLDIVVAPFREQMDLRLYRKPNGGPAGARNQGVTMARGRWIALTDDDCRPHPEWLVTLATALAAEPGAMIGGHTRNGLHKNVFSETSQLLVDYLYQSDQTTAGAAGFITSNNMAVSRDGFLALGGFDERFPLAAGEDRDFCDRWRASGRRIRLVSTARIEHFHALTAAGFWRQHRNYGRGAVRVHDLRSRAGRPSLRFERLSFYGCLVTYPLTVRAPQALRKTLLMGVSQLATTVGYINELLARRARR